ncbi:MAG: polyprenyl synthetase family protein [Bacteroidales bacterium]|nr:polyprenyl synthetase family protein [Bacteroidales bacterium]
MEKIDEFFKQLTLGRKPINLYEPIYYTLSQGGKRLRPRLVMMATKLFDGNAETALYPAAAFEMLHNFTLIHDDIMDDAPIRRGQPTVYRKWNGNIAILSGDALATLALQTMLNTPARPEITLQLSKLIGQTSAEICEGQQLDLDFETRGDVTLDEYVTMIRYKTAVMLAGCLKAGAILSETSSENQEHIYQYGINLGLAFQLKDDLLDVYGDGTVFGKKIGGDIRENKKTYLYLRALQNADAESLSVLQHYFSSINFDEDEKYQAVRAIYDRLDVRSQTEKQIAEFVRSAMQELEAVHVQNDDKKQIFNDLLIELSQRNK